jgi:hypothetical protein
MIGSPPPFVVFGMPRCRTYWLSQFLGYAHWHCGHDEVRHCRSLDDVRSWLSQPYTGTVETAASAFWRLLVKLAPEARIVTVRRPVAEVLDSLRRGGLFFDPHQMRRDMEAYQRKLDQIERRVAGVVSVTFAELESRDVCERVFEHCLPSHRLDHEWWQLMAAQNLQISLPKLDRYYTAHQPQLDKLAKVAKHRIISGMAPNHPEPMDGITFQHEPFRQFYRDAKDLFAEHLVQTGQSPDDHARKNLPLLEALDDAGCLQTITARSNGRMFGYLMSVVEPSLDSTTQMMASHTIFFASSAVRGLGMRLQREAVTRLRARGVSAAILRAGHRGSGPRLGTLYRRLGAEEFGQMYRLELEA